jgi:hypothetical protein
MAKRMSITAIKRKQEIYTNTYDKDYVVKDIFNVDIQPDDSSQDIKDKQFDALQLEISSHENIIVGDKFNPIRANDENFNKSNRKERLKRSQMITATANNKRLLKEEEDINTTSNSDQEPNTINSDSEDSIYN